MCSHYVSIFADFFGREHSKIRILQNIYSKFGPLQKSTNEWKYQDKIIKTKICYIFSILQTLTLPNNMLNISSAVFIFGGIALAVAFLSLTLGGPATQIALSFFGASGGPLLGLFLLGALFPWANWIVSILEGLFNGYFY